jgi:hypothetical protein
MPVRDIRVFREVSQVMSCKTYLTAHGKLGPQTNLPSVVSNSITVPYMEFAGALLSEDCKRVYGN